MKYYELNCLISPELKEEEVKILYNETASLVQDEEGILAEKNPPIRKKLAYPIKKQGQAYLAVLIFQLKPEKLAVLEKRLKAENRILRYLILTKCPEEKAARLGAKLPKAEKPKPKTELKEIEKKLEEILNET